MFAKHLLGSVSRAAVKVGFNPRDRGEYENQTGERVTYELDRTEGRLYRSVEPSNFGGVQRLYSPTAVSTAGELLLAQDNVDGVRLHATDGSGPTALRATYGKSAGTIWRLYGRSATMFAASGSAYRLTHVDLATGQAFPMGLVPRLEAWNSGDDLFAGNATRSGLTGTSGFYTLLPAGNGRAARASIPRQVHEDAPAALFLRMRSAPTPEPVTWAPFNRPMTTETLARGFTLTSNTTYPGVRHPRHGLSVGTHQASVTQVDMSASTGTTTLNGRACSRHTMRSYGATLTGFMTMSREKGIDMIVTQRSDSAATHAVLQYLDDAGAGTGEFVMESTGTWTATSYSTTQLSQSGTAPLFSTARNLLAANGGAGFRVLDYAGTEVATGSYPVTGGTIRTNIVYVPNLDWLAQVVDEYTDTVYSDDLGKSWKPVSFWGARGTQFPNPKPVGLLQLGELARANPFFVT